jgi:hypothetical protein
MHLMVSTRIALLLLITLFISFFSQHISADPSADEHRILLIYIGGNLRKIGYFIEFDIANFNLYFIGTIGMCTNQQSGSFISWLNFLNKRIVK